MFFFNLTKYYLITKSFSEVFASTNVQFLLPPILTCTWYFRLFNFSNLMGIKLASNFLFHLYVLDKWWEQRLLHIFIGHLCFFHELAVHIHWPFSMGSSFYLWFISKLTYILYTDPSLVACSLGLFTLFMMLFSLIFI